MKIKIKQILKLGSLFALLLFAAVACEEEHTIYSGPELVQFADTMVVLPIMDSEAYHEVFISSTKVESYDRNYGVEVVVSETNAIEGYHFDIESNTVTIKAGERVASLKIKGYDEALAESDSLGMTLRLVGVSDDYNLSYVDAHVILQKVCPFDINEFVGPFLVQSKFLSSYSSQKMRVVDATLDPDDATAIILHDYLQDGYNLKVNFDAEDPLNYTLTIDDEQELAIGSQFFGHIYGDDLLRAAQPGNYTSTFSPCTGLMQLYFTIYVESVGVVGTYANTITRLTEAEAEYLRNLGY